MIQKSPYLSLALAVAFLTLSASSRADDPAADDPAAIGQIENVHATSPPSVPIKKVTCHVQIRVEGTVSGSTYTCGGVTSVVGTSGSRVYTFVTGDTAEEAKEYAYNLAVEDALSKQPNCTDFEIVSCDVVPQQYCDWCDDKPAMISYSSRRCRYKVTYTIKCCNGLCYSHSSIDTDRSRAFERAKSAACFWASLNCEGRIRCGCWKTTIVRN